MFGASPPKSEYARGAVYSGKETITRFWQDFFRESPQAHIAIEEVLGLGMRCIVRWRYDWIDGAGTPGHVRGVDIFRVKSGAICEQLSYVKGSVNANQERLANGP